MTSDVLGAFFIYLKSDAAWPTYLPKNLTSYVNAPLGEIIDIVYVCNMYIFLQNSKRLRSQYNVD